MDLSLGCLLVLLSSSCKLYNTTLVKVVFLNHVFFFLTFILPGVFTLPRNTKRNDSYHVLTALLGTCVVVFFFNYLMFLFIFETEREHEQGRGRERGRHRIRSRLRALSRQHRTRRGARIHELRDHDLSQSWTLNQLSHPGAPHALLFKNFTYRSILIKSSKDYIC